MPSDYAPAPFQCGCSGLLPGTPPGRAMPLASGESDSQVEWEVKEEEGEGKGKEGGRGEKEEEERGGGLFHYPYLCMLLTHVAFISFSFKELVLLAKNSTSLRKEEEDLSLAAFSLILHKGEPFRLLWGFLWWGDRYAVPEAFPQRTWGGYQLQINYLIPRMAE